MKTEVLFEEPHIEIGYNQDAKTLHVNWKGNQTIDSMKKGCDKILEFMKARDCNKVYTESSVAEPAYA
jgi:hypothetical protein